MTTIKGKYSKKHGLQILDTLETTNSAFRNRQITLVKDLYEKDKITSVKKAMALIKLVKENKMEEFANKLDEAENKASIRIEQRKIGPELLDTKETKRTIIRLKNKATELPTLEVELKDIHTTFNTAWAAAYKKLIRMAEQALEVKHNIKIVIGIDVVIKKPDTEDKSVHAHTFPINIYAKEDIAKIIREQKVELEKRMQIRINHQEGSGWSIAKIKGLFLQSYTQSPSRGSSYTPTPECFNHPKLSLVNVKNDDNERFKWCLIYHQSEKGKNGERLSVLKKVVDKYNWEGVYFPAGFTDIDRFEQNNKVCVNI